jgi:hypothetical protein
VRTPRKPGMKTSRKACASAAYFICSNCNAEHVFLCVCASTLRIKTIEHRNRGLRTILANDRNTRPASDLNDGGLGGLGGLFLLIVPHTLILSFNITLIRTNLLYNTGAKSSPAYRRVSCLLSQGLYINRLTPTAFVI